MTVRARRRDLVSAPFVATATLLFALLAVAPVRAAALAGPLAVPTLAASAPPPLDPHAAPETWQDAAAVTLTWDVQHQRAATEPATARIAADPATIYVRFDVPQREALLAVQHANDAGDGTDDEVWVDLWPNGTSGFSYQFAVNANGTHWQYSSENTAYSPTWSSYGTARGNGFTVTMAIPLRVMRGAAMKSGWRAQFVRVVRSTGERQIWSYGPAQTNGDDVTYAGGLTGIAAAAASKPSPRVALYTLGGLGAPDSGLTTSRMGADLSIPVTPTASVYATIHPDFSNVEVDQQTISPTAYQRQYNEVRPFFTQGANFYGNFDCDVCANVTELYTPAIPTPRDGYAFEGKQGTMTFAGFDAVGVGRNDGATSLAYQSPNHLFRLTTQDVVADLPGLTDHVETTNLAFNDTKHIDAYLTYGTDAGTNVTDPRAAQRYDGGAYFYTNTFGIATSLRKIGAQYDPVDGYVQHPDIAGYAAFTNKVFLFGPHDVFNSIQVGAFGDRYHDHTGLLDQSDSAGWIDVLTRNRIDAQWNVGSSYLLLPSGTFTPVTQAGGQLTWHSGTANSPGSNEYHGSSSTPTIVSYNTGRFGPGRVDSIVRSSTMTAGPRGTVTLEADDTRDDLDPGFGAEATQWLERLSYTYTPAATASFALGVRRIIGTAPLVDPTLPQPYTDAYNLSFAFHKRFAHDELYLAYGDASQLSTYPQWVFKLIHYFGAQKGT